MFLDQIRGLQMKNRVKNETANYAIADNLSGRMVTWYSRPAALNPPEILRYPSQIFW